VRYRKRPVVIEARQWAGGTQAATAVIDWMLGNGGTARYHEYRAVDAPEHLSIDTLEGTMQAGPGDWIICGIQGEFYPCKPDIFDATYELVEDER
jgi:hypothetical protein